MRREGPRPTEQPREKGPLYFPEEYASLLFRSTAEFPANLTNIGFPIRAASRLSQDNTTLRNAFQFELSPEQMQQAGELASRFHKAKDISLPPERETVASLGETFAPVAKHLMSATENYVRNLIQRGETWKKLGLTVEPISKGELLTNMDVVKSERAKQLLTDLSPILDTASAVTSHPDVKQAIREAMGKMKEKKLTPRELNEGTENTEAPALDVVQTMVDILADQLQQQFPDVNKNDVMAAAKSLVPESFRLQ